MMHLLKNIRIADLGGPYNGQQLDMSIAEGYVEALGTNLEPRQGATLIDLGGCYVSPGFIDIGPFLGDPGYEDREDMASLAAAAQRGGYVAVAPLPNTQPLRHDKSGVHYLLEASRNLPVQMLPLGAISRNAAGQDITEMLDLHSAGAVAFTDGLVPVAAAGLLMRALNYVKAFKGTIINQPFDFSLAPGGQIHEGYQSTVLGLRGITALSETLMVNRDLELLAYTESRLLLHLLSCAESLPLLVRAKAGGQSVFASVSAHHLQFTVDQLADFNPHFKLLPPLREECDRQALVDAVVAGSIDCIVSHHQAHQPEAKNLEFTYADFGSRGLETCFAQAATALAGRLDPAGLAARFSHG
ncbi:MAG: dihydroorotase, partial [Lewinella sp.]|nr:dihydroorotase [Lewinella sp.]